MEPNFPTYTYKSGSNFYSENSNFNYFTNYYNNQNIKEKNEELNIQNTNRLYSNSLNKLSMTDSEIQHFHSLNIGGIILQ